MAKQLSVSVLLVLGAVALLSQGAPSSVSQEKVNMGRDECIKQVADYLAQIEVSEDVEKRLTYARNSYDQHWHQGNYRSKVYPFGCQSLHKRVESMETNVPCYFNTTLMGTDEFQNVREVIMVNELAKHVVEAEYACSYSYGAGYALKQDGLFETITGPDYKPPVRHYWGS